MGWEEEIKIVPASTRNLKVAIIVLFVLVIAIIVFFGVMYTTFTKNTITLALYTETPDTNEDISALIFEETPYTIYKNGIVRIKTRTIDRPINFWLSPYGFPSKEDKISNIVTFTTREENALMLSSSAVNGNRFIISNDATSDNGQLEMITYQYDI